MKAQATRWIQVAEVRPGDHIRVPGFSSWAGWASRDDAERSGQSFRLVTSAEPGWEGTSRTRIVFADGYACQLALDSGVLRLRLPSGPSVSQTVSPNGALPPGRGAPYLA